MTNCQLQLPEMNNVGGEQTDLSVLTKIVIVLVKVVN